MDTIEDAGHGGERGGRASSKGRRHWSRAQKQRIVAETNEPGASVSAVARRNDVNANLVFTWLRQDRDGRLGGDGDATPVLMPVTIAPAEPTPPPASVVCADSSGPRRSGAIEIDLGDGRCVRVGRDVDASALRRVLAVLERR